MFIHDQRDGFLVDMNNVDSLAQELITIYSNRAKLPEMGNLAKTKVEQYFSLDNYIQEIKGLTK